MTSVVTGASGFVGQYLAEYLRAHGEQVIAMGRQACDILDANQVRSIINSIKPTRIFHLAAQSLPGPSWNNPSETFRVNVEGTINLLEAVRSAAINPSIVVVCSSSEYAVSPDSSPIKETDLMNPSNPYAVSKLAVDHMARLYALRYGMNILRVRPFFLIGPGKVGDVCSDLARRVVAVERGDAVDVPVGRLDVIRDFVDVRDGVAALHSIAQKGVSGEDYNICSGCGHKIADILNYYKILGKVPIVERTDCSFMRPIDEHEKVGDPRKIKALGWAPIFTLEDSLSEILEYWRGQSM